MYGLVNQAVDVRDHGEGTGPIGWCAGDDVKELAARLSEAGVADAAAITQHDAVIGCFELMTYEGDGRRTWLT